MDTTVRDDPDESRYEIHADGDVNRFHTGWIDRHPEYQDLVRPTAG
jgi:hypothetical protein